jgi:predicted nucleic acid-binding protein
LSVFVDTSALLAIMDADDASHRRAASAWKKLLTTDETLLTSSYVVVEVFALVQRRLGMGAVRALESDVIPTLNVVWIDAELHRRAVAGLLAASREKLSLVDCASFEVMREYGIRRALTLDRDFSAQGFSVVP